MSEGKRSLYMFVDRGTIQFLRHGKHYGIVLADDRQTATKVRRWLEARCNKRLATAELGTAPGETLGSQAHASIAAGANCLFVTTVDKVGAMQLCPVPF